jgi:hypothetical protein
VVLDHLLVQADLKEVGPLRPAMGLLLEDSQEAALPLRLTELLVEALEEEEFPRLVMELLVAVLEVVVFPLQVMELQV